MSPDATILAELRDRSGRADSIWQPAVGFSGYLDQEVVSLPDDAQERLGFDYLVATSELHDRDLRAVLTTLKHEEVAHTWRKYDVDDTDCAATLRVIENDRRPTLIIGYYGVNHDGSYALLAVGTIAERISQNFAHDGFPVVARCCVNPTYRGRGLYRIVLSHRIELCFRLWGSELKGIHLGTSNPRIVHVLANFRMPRVTGFALVGMEKLGLGATTEMVGAYLLPTKRYARALLRTMLNDRRIAGTETSARVVALLEKFVLTGFSPGDVHELRRLLKDNHLLWRSMEPNHPVRQLLDFARALALV